MATRMSNTHGDFYIYALFRKNGIPFYIGKGRCNRWLSHEQNARTGYPGRKYDIIREIQANGLGLIKIKLHEGLTNKEAYTYETALIKAIGRGLSGPLVNLTDGGSGPNGIKLSPESIAKRSATVRGSKRSQEARANISASMMGKKVSPEHIEKMAAATRGKKKPQKLVERIAAANRGKRMSPEAVARSSIARSGKKRSQETRTKMSIAKLGKCLSIEHRASIGAAHRRRRLCLQADLFQ